MAVALRRPRRLPAPIDDREDAVGGRSRLKGHHGARTWTAWAIIAYNLDTLAIRTA